MNRARFVAFALSVAVCVTAGAQIRSPAEFLGYELGERFTPHHRVVGYFEELAAVSPLADVERYGETTEHRELIRAVFTSENNRANLATIRSRIAEIQSPGETSRDRAIEIATSTPMIALFAFGVHGDETSSPEAAMKVAHWLASDPEAAAILDTLVVVIDPVQNPDGRDQFVQFYRQAAGRVPDESIASAEHDAPWRSGRTNHYFVDMNRDWIWGTQRETQARIKLFLEWTPQLFVDFHEMGSRETDYFFPPSADPVNSNVSGAVTKWFETFGRANARAFSERGWLFYVGETYDLFYPGYGDAWPTLRGAVGMTYEVAGGRRAGKLVERPNGTRLSLTDRLEKHFVAAVTTLETARENRENLILQNYDALAANLDQSITYLLDRSAPTTAFAVEVLVRQGVEIRSLTDEVSLKVRRVVGGQDETRTFPAGTIVVSTSQPAGRIARTLLERSPEIDEAFVRQQKERIDAEESDQFFDITAWSLPIALNIDTWELSGTKLPAVTAWEERAVESVPPSKLGWAVSGLDPNVYRFAGHLLEEGFRFSVASVPVTIGGTTLPRGSIVVHRANNEEAMPDAFPKLARRAGVSAVPIDSFWTRGVALGSSKVQFIRDPRIALVVGGGVSPYSFGAVWFQLDVRDHVPHTLLPLERLGEADLHEFGVIVLPDGDYADCPKSTTERLAAWVREGGTLIVIKGASELTRGEDAGLSEIEERKNENEADGADRKEPVVPRIPGAAFGTEMSSRSFLTFGLTSSPPVLIDGRLAFEPHTRKSANIVRIASADSLAAGFAWPESVERLQGAPYLVIEKAGKGKVITFADNPNFRLFWRGTYPLLMNAILYGPSFDN